MRIAVSAVTFVLFLATIAFFPIPVADRDNEDLRPIADAGPDLTVQENQPVSLNGSASKGSKGVAVFGNNTNVTDAIHNRHNLRRGFNPDVKVDDIGVIHVAWCGQMWNGDRHTQYSKSIDQGLTFREPLALSGYLGFEPGCWARMDADRFGRVHVIWTNVVDSVHPVAYYSVSMDRGDTFNTPVPIDYGSGSRAVDVFSDSNGTIHITLSIYGDPGNMHHIKSEDNGSTFSDPVRINDVPGSTWGGQTVLGPNDTIHAVWMDDRDSKDRSYDIYYSVSFDGGSSFRMSRMVHDKNVVYQARPTLAVDESGNPHVVWVENIVTSRELFYTVSHDGGTSFEEKTLIVNAHDIRTSSIDVGNDGLPQIVWDEWGASYEYYNINYTKMDDIEKKFLRISSVNDDNGVYIKFSPSIDVDSNGTAHVVWVDGRDQEEHQGADIYYAQSTLGRAKIVEYQWDTNSLLDTDGDGNSTNDVDITGPTPSFTYGDDGVYTVTLKVTDELGETASDTAEVTVLNVSPKILSISAKLEGLNASFMFRIAGEKWHNVEVFLFKDSVEVGYVNVTRYPGSPNNQTAVLGNFLADPSKTYSATAYYTPEDDPVNGRPWGATPAWLILKFGNDERRIHHTFNVMHNETWIWSTDNLNQYFPFVVSFEALASDPGSDDLTFTWDWGDGTSSSRIYYNDGVGPDPYPSPEINPISVKDTQRHAFPIAGSYTVVLTVTDDDGGVATATVVVS